MTTFSLQISNRYLVAHSILHDWRSKLRRKYKGSQNSFTSQQDEKFPGKARNLLKKKYVKYAGIFIALIAFIIGGSLLARRVGSGVGNSSAGRTELAAPRAVTDINQQFTFPLMDETGSEVSQINYEIINAELRDEILVQGQKATAVSGRTFLIINVKIKNDFSQAVEIDSRDYLRLKIEGSEELYAPDIHNDPVEVQAISTKPTRLGFPVNISDRDKLILRFGTINAEKQETKINF